MNFFLPGGVFCRSSRQFMETTMFFVGITAGADLSCLHSHLLVLLDQLIQREIRKSRIEDSDQNLAAVLWVCRRTWVFPFCPRCPPSPGGRQRPRQLSARGCF